MRQGRAGGRTVQIEEKERTFERMWRTTHIDAGACFSRGEGGGGGGMLFSDRLCSYLRKLPNKIHIQKLPSVRNAASVELCDTTYPTYLHQTLSSRSLDRWLTTLSKHREVPTVEANVCVRRSRTLGKVNTHREFDRDEIDEMCRSHCRELSSKQSIVHTMT